jgi:hypothetical protein
VTAVWGELPAPNRRWVIVNALVATAVINVVVNLVIDLLTVAGHGRIPLWEPPLVRPSTALTLIGTLFLLPFLTTLLASRAVHHDLEGGSIERLTLSGRLGDLPASRPRRGAALGLTSLVVLGPPLLIAMTALDFPDLGHGRFVAYQVGLAVLLGAVVTPLIAIRAMADGPTAP